MLAQVSPFRGAQFDEAHRHKGGGAGVRLSVEAGRVGSSTASIDGKFKLSRKNTVLR